MTKYQKLYTAVLLYCLSIYVYISAVWQYQNADVLIAKLMFGLVFLAVITCSWLVTSAENTDPYRDLGRAKRKATALKRTLHMYANGLDDGGKFATEVLNKIGDMT